MKVTIDKYSYSSKKSAEADIELISSRIPYCVEDLSPQELAKKVTDGKHCWCPTVFIEIDGEINRLNKHFGYHYYIAVDVDNKDVDIVLFVDDALRILRRYNLEPVFIYTTFRDVSLTKYRIVWAMDEPVADIRLRKIIYKCMVKILTLKYPKCIDEGCLDAARLFFPGKSIVYSNYSSRLNVPQLIMGTSQAIYEHDNKNANTNKERFFNSVNLLLVKNDPLITIYGENSRWGEENCTGWGEECIITYKGAAPIPVQNHIIYVVPETKKRGSGKRIKQVHDLEESLEKIEHVNFDELAEICMLYQVFKCTDDKIDHYNEMRLFTNLLRIKGGGKRIEEGLQSRVNSGHADFTQNWYDKWVYQLSYFISNKQNPIMCCSESTAGYCVYSNECFHKENIIYTIKGYKQPIVEYEARNYKSIQQAEQEIIDIYREVFHND